VCVDLADVIQSLDLPIRLDRKSRRATGWIFAESQTIAIDRDSNTVQIVNNTRPLQPGELYDSPEGWCVDTDALGGWFGVSFRPNLRDSVLALESEKPLPFIDALERKSRAARLRPEPEGNLAAYPRAAQAVLILARAVGRCRRRRHLPPRFGQRPGQRAVRSVRQRRGSPWPASTCASPRTPRAFRKACACAPSGWIPKAACSGRCALPR
jgi:hypothetical protein